MLTKELFTEDNFDPDLVAAVGERLNTGLYSDAILSGFRYLTDILRTLGGVEGDGAQLVGQVLGGNAPLRALNKMQTVSEKDEQKGIEQFLRGMYIGIRNPRTHETIEDTENFTIKALFTIDLALHYLKRVTHEFDVNAFVNRIYDPHFVPSAEYAQALVAEIPVNQVIPVFVQAFSRREEGDTKLIRHAFNAIYQLMSQEQLKVATQAIGEALRNEIEPARIANLFRLLKPESWLFLQDDVRMRMENIIIDACNKGTHDFYGGSTKHGIGTWGNTFGRYFVRIDDLAQMLISKLKDSWYTQNYIGKYYMYILPTLIKNDFIHEASQSLAYAAIGNRAIVVREKLREVCRNYPDPWKNALKIAIQERKENDSDYADEILRILN